ncbi:MAG TPA: 2-amino-4-hydroxy-6-hydroxymethyldihydropteridine diphosphokinase [candidate division Zixibacteria bacterium]|jgi:2-amino-4-hydroxy-6-hydroxymethyldihydropteridine diphosphokinase|nr:2-amino-4-hydroxy-6-hydroxymethyldihydropteridine diphosphokinase [candidate division Zixibacteria bacterium]HBZ01845.1 2-amino-4-hydroxy-6-hydroxymethyldihydropteridine diphosphokinase [candidate division Zixibacteria bacterium]
MADVFLGLGSNLGDKIANIREALGLLDKSGKVKVLSLSSLYETEPVGVSNQPEYVNCVAQVETILDPHSLLNMLKVVEASMGRKPNMHLRPRVIDLDILLYDEIDLESLELVIPHSRLKSRRFVLEPLLEISPQASDPISGKPFSDFLADVSSQKIKKIASANEVWHGPGRSTET